ncbi:hypothetical protein GQ457_13G015620 [Hibiscus cannabinus]
MADRNNKHLLEAAKESDALLEANNKLEKQVEELTWQLQKMQRGGANNIAGQVPVIQGASVIDDESMNKLTAENEQLKALVDATEKKYEETNKLSEERLKQVMEAEMKIIELKSAMQRLEEKISDLETEDKVLRQQALLSGSSKNMSSQMSFTTSTNEDDNDHMAYWLSNISALLFLLQCSLKSAAQKPPAPTSFFSRMTQSFRSSSSNLAIGEVRQVEGKYPALLFKQQITAYVEKIYGIIRDNLKKELSSHISRCIQVPKISKGTPINMFEELEGNCSPASHWEAIIESLNKFLGTLKENFVPPVLVQKIFTQIFAYINTQFFNSFLVRRECCTLSNGEYVKYGLIELELWCAQAADEVLSVQQLFRICWLFRDDKYNTPNVSPNVIASMKHLMPNDSEDDGGDTFLLEDDIRSVQSSTSLSMASSSHIEALGDSQPTNKPPYFNGANYTYWKNRMKLSIQTFDLEAWKVIVSGYSPPSTGMESWNHEESKKLSTNAKAMHLTFCALGPDEYGRVSSCSNAKEIWDKLEVTHEGTNEGYGEAIPEDILVWKMIYSLPHSWDSKKTAIIEANNLKTIKFDDLIGSLLTHEMIGEDEENEMTMFAKRFKRFMKSNSGRRFQRREDFKNKNKEEEKDQLICFECKKPGHMKVECPNLRKKSLEKKKHKRFVDTWSDEDVGTSYVKHSKYSLDAFHELTDKLISKSP